MSMDTLQKLRSEAFMLPTSTAGMAVSTIDGQDHWRRRSMNAMISPAMSLPVKVSMPSRPGVEITSSTKGPLPKRMLSTPQALHAEME